MEVQARIVDTLGGPRVLGARRARLASSMYFDQILRRGLPVASLEAVAALLKITTDALVPVLGSSRATIERRRTQGGVLTPTESDGLYRLASTVAHATDVFGSEEAARRWVLEPQRGLGNREPFSLLGTTPGYGIVEQLLGRIEHGVYT